LALNQNKTFALTHVYAQNGSYTVTVNVTDNDGGVGTGTALVTVNNVAPAVNAGPNATINEGGLFSSAGSFVDPGADNWSATVNYGDGSGQQSLALNANKTFSLNHAYAQDGLYTVTVTVTDSDGAAGSGTAVVTVNNVSPLVNAGPDAAINAGGTFNSTGSFVDPGADIWTATVDYGDGSGMQPLALNANKTFALSHVYSNSGSYTVTVTVQDNSGGTGSDTAIVTVSQVIVPPGQTITNLTARAKPGKADLVWTCVPGNVTYSIYRSTTAGGPYSRITSNYTSTYCTYADMGLSNSITYYWRVTSVDAGGLESLQSNEASAKPVAR
jgi:PKD repeat protein